MPPRSVITLIHGTFARNAQWIGEDSTLRAALKQSLEGGVEIFAFNWSGWMSHGARRKGAEELKNELRERLREYPDSNHYLIGHSHGGNVALYSRADEEVSKGIKGIVSLATPFIVARDRDIGPDAPKYFAIALLILAAGLEYLLMRMLGLLTQSSPILWLAGIISFCLIGSACLKLYLGWQGFASKIRSELELPEISPQRLLIVRSPADEASAFLLFSQFLWQLSMRVFFAFMSLFGRVQKFAISATRRKVVTGLIGSLAVITWLAVIVFAILRRHTLPGAVDSETKVAMVLTAFFALGGLAMASFALCAGKWKPVVFLPRVLVAALIWPLVLLLGVLLLVPFGWQVAVGNILLDVTTETTPLGTWTVHQLQAPSVEQMGRDAPPLMHSAIWENPRTFKLVVDWIAGSERDRGDG